MKIFVPSGIASRLRTAPEGERRNPLTFYTIYYIDGGLGGGHLTPKLVGFLDPARPGVFRNLHHRAGRGIHASAEVPGPAAE